MFARELVFGRCIHHTCEACVVCVVVKEQLSEPFEEARAAFTELCVGGMPTHKLLLNQLNKLGAEQQDRSVACPMLKL